MKVNKTSWQSVAGWYAKLVDEKGHYYHRHVVIPGVLKLLGLEPQNSLLDLACGQGVLGRSLPNGIRYFGIDIALDLIAYARKADRAPGHTYRVGDASKPIADTTKGFTAAAIVLALQNIENTGAVIQNAADCLDQYGKFVIVLNHPAFRIPRQTSWGIDEANKLQYRRINRYLSPLSIPIEMHPGSNPSQRTWSFHQPISYYVRELTKRGFVIDAMEEWVGDKTSEGSAAKMENRSRAEIPLFLAIRARKT